MYVVVKCISVLTLGTVILIRPQPIFFRPHRIYTIKPTRNRKRQIKKISIVHLHSKGKEKM